MWHTSPVRYLWEISMRSIVFAAVLCTAPVAFGQLVNGSFEEPDDGFRSVGAGQTYAGWTCEGPNDIEFVYVVPHPNLPNLEFSDYNGEYWVDLCGVGAPSGIFQDISGLDAGQQYQIDFGFSANVWGPDFNFVMDVLWNGQVVGNFSVIRGGNDGLQMNWEDKSVTVTALPGSNRLTFRALTATNARGPAIDGIEMFPVPAPSAIALLGVGGLIATRRKR